MIGVVHKMGDAPYRVHYTVRFDGGERREAQPCELRRLGGLVVGVDAGNIGAGNGNAETVKTRKRTARGAGMAEGAEARRRADGQGVVRRLGVTDCVAWSVAGQQGLGSWEAAVEAVWSLPDDASARDVQAAMKQAWPEGVGDMSAAMGWQGGAPERWRT